MTTRRRPTMADVAERAGVSLSTVSLTYSGAGPITDETKARVQKAAKDLGYGGPSPLGKSLRSGRTGVIAVVVSEKLVHSFRDPNTLRVMDGLVDELGTMGLSVLLVPPPTGIEGETTTLDTAAMDAAIIMRVRDEDDPSLEVLKRRGIPVVIMEGPAIKGAGLVTIDDAAGTAQLIGDLANSATSASAPSPCRSASDANARSSTRPTSASPLDARAQPSRAFALAGIEPCVVVEAAASMVEEGIAAGHLAISHESRPTALVCQSDLLAAGVIIAARELDVRVPQDLSVVGFDGLDLPVARASPAHHHGAGRRPQGQGPRARGQGLARRRVPRAGHCAAGIRARHHHRAPGVTRRGRAPARLRAVNDGLGLAQNLLALELDGDVDAGGLAPRVERADRAR